MLVATLAMGATDFERRKTMAEIATKAINHVDTSASMNVVSEFNVHGPIAGNSSRSQGLWRIEKVRTPGSAGIRETPQLFRHRLRTD